MAGELRYRDVKSFHRSLSQTDFQGLPCISSRRYQDECLISALESDSLDPIPHFGINGRFMFHSGTGLANANDDARIESLMQPGLSKCSAAYRSQRI